jgi:hypothetical protein
MITPHSNEGGFMNTALNTLSILILGVTTIVISSVNYSQETKIQKLQERVLMLEETK